MQSPDSQDVIRRFFAALDAVIKNRDNKLRGRATFCRRYDIDRRNLYQLEKDMSRDIFKAAWLTYLVRDFGVSAQWLLTGEGEMMGRRRPGRPAGPALTKPSD